MRVVIDTNVIVSSYLGGALEGSADVIVSGDAHLLELKDFRGIPILTAREFLDQLTNH